LEEFIRDYLAFRSSLYAYRGVDDSVLVRDYFSGAVVNADDFCFKIPSLKEIKIEKCDFRFPIVRGKQFAIGTFFLNGDGAPFDIFTYVTQTNSKPLLLAFQVKLAYPESKSPQKITNSMIETEYAKTRNSIHQQFPNLDFVFILIGRCDGEFDMTKLPRNCVIVSNCELREFFGDYFYSRLTQA
jgi:hypothetical protein